MNLQILQACRLETPLDECTEILSQSIGLEISTCTSTSLLNKIKILLTKIEELIFKLMLPEKQNSHEVIDFSHQKLFQTEQKFYQTDK